MKISQIEIKVSEETLTIISPFSTANNNKFRSIGGKYSEGWNFKNKRRVWELIDDLWGIDPISNTVVRVLASEDYLITKDNFLQCEGYVLAQRKGRDTMVSTTPGVEIEVGSWASSGGSRNYPRVTWEGDLMLSFNCTLAFAKRLQLQIVEQKSTSPLAQFTTEELKTELERRAANT